MKKWMLQAFVAVAFVGLFSASAEAQNPFRKVGEWWKRVRSQFELDTQRNNALPQPFATADQMTVQRTFSPMFYKGATLARVLDSVHFDPKTHELNNAGRTRLRQILNDEKPLDILVASTLNPEIDRQRQDKIKGILASYSFPGNRPGVATTFHLPHHKFATERADLRQRYFNAQPAPALESVDGAVSGSTGGQ